MELVCLDLEGVLVPEIWIAVAEKTGIEELRLTTRDISDYDELMNHRLGILDREQILLKDIQEVIGTLEPLDGAFEFTTQLRKESQLVILSDTFEQFASALMRKLDLPTLFCNTLVVEDNGRIAGYRLRQADGKRKAVEAFRSMGLRVFAAGDSYNDLSMLKAAHRGMLFRAPDSIKDEFPAFSAVETHSELLMGIRNFLSARPITTL
jgi:phosphoserine/homoserine phosphotransferase